MEPLQYCLLKNTQVPSSHRENTKKTTSSNGAQHNQQSDCRSPHQQQPPSQTEHNTCQGSLPSASLIAPRLIIGCKWRTNGQWKGLHSILLTEHLPTKYLNKALVDLCLPFEASSVITRTELSKLTNVVNTWTTLELQPSTLPILPRTSGSLQVLSPNR